MEWREQSERAGGRPEERKGGGGRRRKEEGNTVRVSFTGKARLKFRDSVVNDISPLLG